MIYAHLSDPQGYSPLLNHPVWGEAFDCLRRLPVRPDFGTHEIRGQEMFLKVMEYETLPREQCMFESHREYIDLQYTLHGGEFIDWHHASELKSSAPFDTAGDVQFYAPAESRTRLHMPPGAFAIFFPTDAHQPKISDGVNRSVYKVVIKIAVRSVQMESHT